MLRPVNKGDLVHVPEQTTLLSFGEKKSVRRFYKVERPISLLVVSENNEYYSVLYDSEVWYVKKNEVNKIG